MCIRDSVNPEEEKTLRDYITEYQYRAKNNQVHQFAAALGLDEEKLRDVYKRQISIFRNLSKYRFVTLPPSTLIANSF